MFAVDAPDHSFIPDFLPELTDAVMEVMDGEDLLRIRQVSTTAETYVAATIHVRTRALFQNTLIDYDALVDALDTAGAVIGGAAATHILFPFDTTPPTHLKIYTPYDAYCDVLDHLSHQQRFHSAAVPTQMNSNNFPPEGVEDMSTLRKNSIIIDIVQSTNRSAILPIASEPHSALFNYVSTRSYSSAYPLLNRQHVSLLNPSRLTDYVDVPDWLREEVDRWSKDGWLLGVEWERWAPGGQCRGVHSAGCPSAIRAFGDRHSFTGSSSPVHGRGVTSPPDKPNQFTAVWWRGGHTCGPQCHSGQDVISPEMRTCLRAIIHR